MPQLPKDGAGSGHSPRYPVLRKSRRVGHGTFPSIFLFAFSSRYPVFRLKPAMNERADVLEAAPRDDNTLTAKASRRTWAASSIKTKTVVPSKPGGAKTRQGPACETGCAVGGFLPLRSAPPVSRSAGSRRKKVGTNSTARQVEASMPENTVMPIDFRAIGAGAGWRAPAAAHRG